MLTHLPLLHNVEPIVTAQRGQHNMTQCKQPIMSDAAHKCELCGRRNFKSQRGLSKHKLENKGGRDHLEARFGSNTDAKIAAACLPADAAHEPQKCAAGSQNAMHCPDVFDGSGAKRAKHMSLPDKDFTSAWPMKAQSQPEQSQPDNDSDAGSPHEMNIVAAAAPPVSTVLHGLNARFLLLRHFVTGQDPHER